MYHLVRVGIRYCFRGELVTIMPAYRVGGNGGAVTNSGFERGRFRDRGLYPQRLRLMCARKNSCGNEVGAAIQ